ncbi:hypothetical protein JXA80_02955, partial [bacterium]|nr:hypothetical protein [candidate division CSSED10-310 bacterium]
AHTHDSPPLDVDLEKGLNLIILSGLLFFLLRKPASRMFVRRQVTIRHALRQTEKNLQESQQNLDAARLEKDRTATLIDELEHETRVQTQRQVDALIEDAHAKTVRLEEAEQKRLSHLEADAIARLHSDTVRDALSRVETQFARGIDPETDRRLVAEFIAGLASVKTLEGL